MHQGLLKPLFVASLLKHPNTNNNTQNLHSSDREMDAMSLLREIMKS